MVKVKILEGTKKCFFSPPSLKEHLGPPTLLSDRYWGVLSHDKMAREKS
jgi:hypothetical protein